MECVNNITIPDPTLWRWKRHENALVPRWQNLDSVDFERVSATFTCKVKLCQNCKCSKLKIACLPSCTCRRTCENV